jgi:hypothetical protein
MVAVHRYAEAALGNREFFWNKPFSPGLGHKKTRLRLTAYLRASAAMCMLHIQHVAGRLPRQGSRGEEA